MAAKDAARTGTFRKSTAREYFESIVIAVILALFIRTWVVQAFKIPTGSMENNLLVGDHLLVNKFIYGPTATELERALLPVREVRRGDVVVFKYPVEPERDFIKRVIGLPGETLELRRKRVYINGELLDESAFNLNFLRPPSPEGAPPSYDITETYGPVTIPEGHYFVMGDNRDNSQDSRTWSFLPATYLKGRAMMIYWSYDPEATGPLSIITATRWNRLFHQIH